jgi:pyruvate,water dikinase
MEIDVASPRYRDDPRLLLSLVLSMRNAPPGQDPQSSFDRNAQERRLAYERLHARLRARSKYKAWLLRRLYRVYETLGGYRETHKYCLVWALDLIRRRVQKEGAALASAGRLDSPRCKLKTPAAWSPTGFVDSHRSGTMVYEERTGSGTGSQEVHPGV